jgi:hypothetical protein
MASQSLSNSRADCPRRPQGPRPHQPAGMGPARAGGQHNGFGCRAEPATLPTELMRCQHMPQGTEDTGATARDGIGALRFGVPMKLGLPLATIVHL